MRRTVRDLFIKSIAKSRPQLFYYKSGPAMRRDIRVKSTGIALDIVKPAERKIIRIGKSNAIYLVDMIESFDYFFGSADPVRLRVHGELHDLIDFSTPRLHMVAGFDDFAVLCPSLTEPYSTTAQYLDFAGLSEGDTAIDLGSYSALTSIAFSKEVGRSGTVLAIEPDPLNFTAAKTNLASHRRVNELDNVTLAPLAVSATAGVLKLSSEGAMGSALTSIVGGSRGETIEVEAVTLQDLVDRHGLERVDFIKMDIEGAEREVIRASGEFLRRYRPKMIIEPHMIERTLTSAAIVPFLTDIGYRCDVIDQPGLSLPLITARPG